MGGRLLSGGRSNAMIDMGPKERASPVITNAKLNRSTYLIGSSTQLETVGTEEIPHGWKLDWVVGPLSKAGTALICLRWTSLLLRPPLVDEPDGRITGREAREAPSMNPIQ